MAIRIPDELQPLNKPLAWIKPNPANANRHPESQIAALVASFTEFGVDQPVITNAKGVLIAGHGRLEAAKQLGMTEYPVVVNDLSSLDATRRMIGDNRLVQLAEPDTEALGELLRQLQVEDALAGTGYDDGAVDALLAELAKAAGPQGEDKGPQIDRAAELQAYWGTALGQVWELGEHRLVCGDCTDKAVVEAVMRGEKAALMFTDPPFNVGYDYDTYQDDRDDYPEWTRLWVETSASVLADNAWLFVMNITKNIEMTLVELSRVARFANLIVWPHGTGAIPSDRFALGWQCIAAYRKGKAQFNSKAQTIASVISDERGGGINPNGRITDIWDDIKPVTAGSRASKEAILNGDAKSKVHHAQMPLALPERATLFCSASGDVVYEPFSGSGTTLAACERTGRKARCIEIDKAYIAVTLQRWADMTGKTPRLIKQS